MEEVKKEGEKGPKNQKEEEERRRKNRRQKELAGSISKERGGEIENALQKEGKNE